jgi:hypothetical protein
MIHNKEQIITIRQLLKANAPAIFNSYKALKLQKTTNNSSSLGEQKPTTEETLVGNTAL